ncbi:type II secretion system protein E [Sulfuricella denitrificans skB26]|uniref:Type II secretion system protein E n=1 Tax=Sulfuricella denitrificans (strain DSM 22764 / NBRC 105220 / skB26) TaxID=1163617 RepID=S6AIN0_SULDS|nr:ATPase, T2SS/T4P/T4SS family [Sulfuricella denitrificans]BAN36106.1 type II secretion system protein E [Sulfuricella denitrificans skB26]
MANYTSLFTGMPDEVQPSQAEPAKAAVYRILLVDDEPNVLKALQRVFRQENYEIVLAGNGPDAIDLLRKDVFHLMISDYMMPGMTGAQVLKQAKAIQPDMIRIMLTGHADTGAVMGAINEGAVYKFILKPWNDDDLRVTMAIALEQFDLIQKNRALQKENSKKSIEISALAKMAVTNRSQLAIMLNKRGLLNSQQVQELHRLQQTHKEPIIKLLLERDWIPEKTLRDILRQDFLVEEVALGEFQIDPAIAALIPQSFCERQWVVPLKQEGRRLMLAVADPMDSGLVDDLRFVSGLEIQAVMADVASIKAKIAEVYGREEQPSFEDLETLVSSVDPYEGIEVVIDEEEDQRSLEELLRGTEEPPAIRLVNAIILEAIRLGASDIHIHPRTKSVVVRLRIDGVLADKIHIPHQIYASLVSRLKVMSELDISERRRPQDGRITVKTPLRIVDLRISTLPTINGEKVVMRILDRNSAVKSIEGLGFSPADLKKVLNMVDKPQGIILTTGPTGSGKTTTLYGLLQHNADPGKNYVTIEDPVEYYLDMAGQVLIKEKIGLTFPVVLRSILRQDPDVVLLGEIRDLETAEVAFHAALTGHLVYSTLHTNSAVATIARLFDLGLKPYVVATALEGIIAQRLVRRICDDCSEPVTPAPELLARLGPLFEPGKVKVSRGRGCTKCHNTGYRGRLGIYEVLVPDENMSHLIASGASILEMTKMARQIGTTPMIEDAREKVNAGLTTLEEVLRVLGPQR